MTEAAGGGRAEMERKLIQRGLEDESFRQTLLARAAIEGELGTRLPEGIKVVAAEETSDTWCYRRLPRGPRSRRKTNSPIGSWRAWPVVAPGVPVKALSKRCSGVERSAKRTAPLAAGFQRSALLG